tara:strand:- start:56 stop:637 length:582 start_codon:yes stop_codon:yes gene_type:complete
MKYQVILADPPWKTTAGRPLGKYIVKDGKQLFGPKGEKSRKLEYPTMSVEDIKSLNVKDVAADDAHLYMWVTNSHLPYAFDIIKEWGFNYSTMIVWAKNMMGGGLGGAYKINTEYLIFARKGSLKTTQSNKGTWYNVKRAYENGAPKHSKKPDFFYEMIEATSPGNKLEMFARNKRANWHTWGNEITNDIELT